MEKNTNTSFDTSRFIETPVGWYVVTREQSDLGPFLTQHEAEQALKRHIQMYKDFPRIHNLAMTQGIFVHETDTCWKTNCALCAEANVFKEELQAS